MTRGKQTAVKSRQVILTEQGKLCVCEHTELNLPLNTILKVNVSHELINYR